MKKLFPLLLILAFCQTAQAQFELKVNPIALLFTSFQASVEFRANENLGIEPDVFVVFGDDAGGGWVYCLGKYYFDPKFGFDRFHAGAFAGPAFGFGDAEGAAFGLGFMAGYKAVSAGNFVFDAGLGIGRAFSGEDLEILPYGKLSVGYRFNGKKKGK